MIDVLAVLGAVGIGAALAGALSATFFGDYREGFRVLWDWMQEPDMPDRQSDERPTASAAAQVVLFAVILVVTVIAFVSLRYWLHRALL